ncbi:MAG TPA: indole-3-glycerol phosphate synthase TrpC [Bryobacteraceae bacterium]|nr:indole-3-glycerol phosphate synthase TrpC [Bryobacteraceae bacterium]
MVTATPDVLARIVAHKRTELAALEQRRSEFEARADASARRDFRGALLSNRPAIIAEIKKASPSKGLLCRDFDPPKIAAGYESGQAAAISVLTDEAFFQGSLADLESARRAVGLPVLRKDFTLEDIHVWQAAAHGADAILLIAAILTVRQMCALRELARTFGIASLVEVHDAEELRMALDSGADIVGVNNRNLHTFEVTLELSLQLAERIPANVIRVSESGIHSAADIRLLRSAGYHAFLVGEHLMTSPDPATALRCLLQ